MPLAGAPDSHRHEHERKRVSADTLGRDGAPPPGPGERGAAVRPQWEARIRDLEQENARLRRIVADRDLEIEMLREISRGTY